MTLFVVPLKMRGPRTSSFRNTLSFRKIRKHRVRGPSHIGLPSVILMPVSPPYSHSGDMHPDDATEGVFSGAYLPSSFGLCQDGCRLHLHRRKGKVEGQISSWRIVVLCTETSTEARLCAQGPYQRLQFRTALGTDSSLQLRMTIKIAPLDLHKGKKYGWNVYFCCIKETGQPTVK